MPIVGIKSRNAVAREGGGEGRAGERAKNPSLRQLALAGTMPGHEGIEHLAEKSRRQKAVIIAVAVRNLAQVVKYLDNSIQEAEKAAATTAAAGPIANNAAIPNPAGQNGASPVAGLGSQPAA